ncbi:MAG: deoxyribonuclease II family protein [Polyangiaceae bacterium]
MANAMSPLNEQGKPVDWWFLYKVPKLAAGPDTTGAQGYEYVYFDGEAQSVSKSPYLLSSGQGALDLTLKSVFDAPAASTGWVLYNDEMPASASRKDNGALGHTKGVIAFDTATRTALWLLHSWPKYADPGAVGMPTPMYGQTFLCIAIDLPTASKLADQMSNHQEPQTYLPHVPGPLPKSDPLFRLTQPLDPRAPGDSDVVDYRSRGGLPFKVIAKNREWGQDFWNDLVGPTLGADLDVDTWIRGPVAPTADSDGIHKTFDIKFIDLRELGAPWAWPETHDHAKWGITYEGNWVCVGDINRMISQEQRGGGTIAFQSAALWAALRKTDLLVLPKGVTEDQAVKTIHATHAKAPPPKRRVGTRRVQQRA